MEAGFAPSSLRVRDDIVTPRYMLKSAQPSHVLSAASENLHYEVVLVSLIETLDSIPKINISREAYMTAFMF